MSMKKIGAKLLSFILAISLVVGMLPDLRARAAEMQGGMFDPKTGSLTLEFAFQTTQYVDINVYVRSLNSSDSSAKISKGSIVRGFFITGASDVSRREATEKTEEPHSVTQYTDPSFHGITDDGLCAAENDPSVNLMKHTLTWDGTINGIPLIGPNLKEDVFILTVEIDPLGRPDKNVINVDEDGNISGDDYTWPHDGGSKKNAISTDILVDYRNYAEGQAGSKFLMLRGGLSDQMRSELYEAFLSGSMNCSFLTNHPDIVDLTLSHNNLDPVDMITGAYQFTYTDMRLESYIPLSLIRAYSSRYSGGSLGKGFTHSYEYSLRKERGIVHVTMPGGEEQVFLQLSSSYSQDYDSLQDSDFTLKNAPGGGYLMLHKDGAQLAFSSAGKLLQVRNPDGVTVAALTYAGEQLSKIEGVAGSYSFSWNGNHISQITDSAGRTTEYGYQGDNLISVTNCDGDTLHYTYDQNGYLASASDFAGEVYLENTYDGSGRVTEQHFWNADQELVSTVAYDDSARVNTCTDFYGQMSKYYYDSHRNILKIEDVNGESANGYADSAAASVTDNQGNIVSYDRDSRDNVTAIHYQDGSASTLIYNGNDQITSITDAEGYTERFTYSGANITEHTDKNGNLTRYEYNGLGLPSKVIDALGGETVYTYDSAGRLISVTNPAGETIQYGYDSVGRLESETDAMENATHHSYSPAGKLLETRDAMGNVTTYEYNANNVSTKTTDALGHSVSTEYGSNGQPISKTDALGNKTVYTYNEQGLVSEIADPLGNTTLYEYDEQGRAVKITDPDGNETSCAYDSLSRITSTTDALGNVTSYEYDPMGRITGITAPNGAKTRYAFDKLGRTVSVTDAENGNTGYTYDGNGNLLSTTDAEGIVTSSTYDELNRLSSETDGEGNSTAYRYDPAGRVILKRDALGGETHYTYDKNGNLLTETDAAGNTTSYAYDALNRVISTTDAEGGVIQNRYDAVSNLTEVEDALGNITKNTYYADGKIQSTTDPLGNVTRYTYDACGRTESVTNADGGVVRYEYTPGGAVSKITDPLGNATLYEYDANGQRSKAVNAAGNVIQYRYDSMGNVTEVYVDSALQASYTYDKLNRALSVTDSNGNSSYTEYNKVGSILSRKDRNGNITRYTYDQNYRPVQVTDAAGGITSYTYDAVGNQLSVTDAMGNTEQYAYDPVGNLLKKTDALGGVTAYTYDSFGNVKTETDPLGSVSSYAYDLNGQLTESVAPNGKTAFFTYDGNGNQVKVRNRENEITYYEFDSMNRLTKKTNQLNHSEVYTYDLAGNVLSYTDGNKYTKTYRYDSLNRLASETSAGGSVTDYEYDVYGNLIKLTADAGNGARSSTVYEFDREGNLLSETAPDGSSSSFTFDGEGNLIKSVDENGTETEYTYDVLGNNTGFVNEDGETAYTYDKVGNLKTAVSSAGAVTFEHDALYRTIQVVNEDGGVTAYSYDAAGFRTGIIYPDGKGVSYEYDAVGNVTALTDYDGSVTKYAYDGEGRRKKELHPDGSTTEYGFNNAGQLTHQAEVSKENNTIREILYGYDDAGNLKSEQRTGVDIDRRDESVRYYYDKDNQLIRSVIEGKTTVYQYDKAGNLLSDGEFTYTYNNRNQLLTKAGADGKTEYSYDPAGNLLKKVSPDGVTDYVYDSQNRLIKGEKSDGSSSEYVYNAMGVRIENTQVRPNENAGYSNADQNNGSGHIKDYLPSLIDDRADWQPTWEDEVGGVHQNDKETVTTHYTVDYLSEQKLDLTATVDGSYSARYVYTLSEARLSAEFTYADGTERGEGGENPASDFSANDINKVWYRSNLTGSSLYAVDKDGETVSHAVYNAWGKLQSDAPTDMNFTGMEGLISYSTYSWDVTLELYFAQNRFYDPADKRFTQEDKTEDGVNWYLYVENNPLIFVDADGNMMVPVEKCGGGRVSKPKTARTIPVKKPPVNKPKATPAPSNVTKAVANAAKQVIKTATQAVKNTVPSVKPTPKPATAKKNQQQSSAALARKKFNSQKMQDLLKQQQEQVGCKPKSPFSCYDPANPLKLSPKETAELYRQGGLSNVNLLALDPEVLDELGIDLTDPWVKRQKENWAFFVRGTASLSLEGSFVLSQNIGGTASIGIAVDRDGNIAFVKSYGVVAGVPSAFLGGVLTVTDAPNIKNLEGESIQVGGSFSASGVSVGGELTSFQDPSTLELYSGGSISVGFSPDVTPEIHGSVVTTEIIYQWNIFYN